jgi:Lrp/AsnC family transcriptional regulator, regulator for asnA, asnC and gidA
MSDSSAVDDLDRKILAQLQVDARLPNRIIAMRVGSTEATVRRRIDRLTGAGLVKIVAVASPFALGYRVVAIIGVRIDRSYQRQIEQALDAMPEVRFVGLTLGSYDAILEVWLPSAEALLAFLADRLSPIPGVERAEAWQVLKLSKYSYDWGEQPSASL